MKTKTSIYDQGRSWVIQICPLDGAWKDVDNSNCPLPLSDMRRHRLSTKSLTLGEALYSLHKFNVLDQDPQHIYGVSPATGKSTDYSYRAHNGEMLFHITEVFTEGPQNRFTIYADGALACEHPPFGYGTLTPYENC